MRVVFRADATQQSGAGHVMRCWALAEEFRARGVRVALQGSVTVPWVQAYLQRVAWQMEDVSGSALSQAARARADLVVVDSYDLSGIYREALLNAGVPVLAIVDEGKGDPGPASIWVNPGPVSAAFAQLGSACLNGPEYILLRREIRDLRRRRERVCDVDTVPSGITFLLGGTDFAGMAKLIERIADDLPLRGDVFAGPGRFESAAGVSWLPGGLELIRRACDSTLVVSAAGVSSWEMTHIGVPLALFQVAENQERNYSWLTEAGCAFPMGRFTSSTSPEVFLTTLQDAIAAARKGRSTGPCAVDGLGASRVVDAALALL